MTDRSRARALASAFVQAGAPLDWFEVLYDEAANGNAVIPWADGRPNPNLIGWLDRKDFSGDDQRALVVGCGYGDDAEEMARRGCTVTAFDISSTAIAGCRERFPNSQVRYEVADLLKPPSHWLHRFDFVFEAYTLQVLPRDLRTRAMANLARIVATEGTLLVVTRGRDTTDSAGDMPWPLLRDELFTLKSRLQEVEFDDYVENEQPPVRRFRVEYRDRSSSR